MSKRKKKELGRPAKKKNLYPPRVDATPEDMAQAMFSLPAGRKWEYLEAGPEGPVYRCADCEREVNYPTLCTKTDDASPATPSPFRGRG